MVSGILRHWKSHEYITFPFGRTSNINMTVAVCRMHPSRWLWQSYVWVLASLSAGMGCRWLHRRHYGFIDTITLITPIVQQTVLFNIRMNSINQSSPCQPRTNVSSAIFVHFFLFFFFLFSIEIVNVPAFGTRSFRFDIEKVFFLFCRCPRRK